MFFFPVIYFRVLFFLFVRDCECDAIVNFLFGRRRRSLFFFLPGGGRARPNEIVARLRDYTIRGHFYGHDLHIAFLFRAPVAHSQKDKTKEKEKKKNRKCLCLQTATQTHKRRTGFLGTSRGQHCMAMAPPTFLLLCQQQQQLGVKIVFSPREKKRR
jgi:hypothetical protein